MHKYGVFILGILVIAIGLFLFMRLPAQAPVVATASPSVSVSATPEPNIIVLSPKPGEQVSNPIHVVGKARVFEATFVYRLLDASGRVLIESNAMTRGPSVPDYGDIDIKVPVLVRTPEVISGNANPLSFTLEVFEYSAKDGAVVNLVSVPVTLATNETSTTKAYFTNAKLDNSTSCTEVFPVDRKIYKTQEVGYMAVTELLRGPTDAEKVAGYQTAIPKDFRLNTLVINNGTATVDFQNYAAAPAGSCFISSIRAQITKTLQQFSSIKKVVISINGRTEDALQP